MLNKERKPKKCRVCKEFFTPVRTFEICCGYECSIDHAKAKMTAKRKKEVSRVKREFKNSDKSHLMKIAQKTFNQYIRARDKDLPCVSCGHVGTRQRHASHFRPVGRNGKLRFNEKNCHASCSICNQHLSGNLVPYREAMIRMYGEAEVEKLEADNDPYKYSIDELKEITEKYKQKTKDLTDHALH